MQITSDFAILDVKEGRKELAEHIAAGGIAIVTIQIRLDTIHSRDDGTSIEFSGGIESLSQPQLLAPAEAV